MSDEYRKLAEEIAKRLSDHFWDIENQIRGEHE